MPVDQLILPRALPMLLFAALVCPAALAGADLKRVRGQLDVGPDGSGTATWWCEWMADSAVMKGFFFPPTAGRPRFNKGGVARLETGEEIPVVLSPASGNRWEVALEGGRSAGPGTVTFVLSYDIDLLDAGIVGATQAGDGAGFFWLQWLPPVWEDEIDWQELTLRFPTVPAPAGDMSFYQAYAATGLRAEPWLNENNVTRYVGAVGPDPSRATLEVRVARDDVAFEGTQKVELFLPAKGFPGIVEAVGSDANQQEQERRRDHSAMAWQGQLQAFTRWGVALPSSFILALLALGISMRKHRGLARAASTAPEALWDLPDWEPPRLRLDGWRRPGKVADLTAIEALVLLGLPFGPLLHMTVDALVADGLALRESDNSGVLVARTGEKAPADNPFLAYVWRQLPERPATVPGSLAKALGERVVGTVQRNAWDCDLEASRGHYRGHFGRLFPNQAAVGEAPWRGRCRPEFFPWWVSRHHCDGAAAWLAAFLETRDGEAFPVGYAVGQGEHQNMSDFDDNDVASAYEPSACRSPWVGGARP